jgi:DNA ligase-associated metallophosphoesterase
MLDFCCVYTPAKYNIDNEIFELHPLKAMFHANSGTLVCSDIHIGKAGHFRTQGIAISRLANSNNAWNLAELFREYKVQRLVVVGDIVHSKYNQEWEDFIDFLASYPSLEKILVVGNHDTHAEKFLEKAGFSIAGEWTLGKIRFTHEPTSKAGYYNVSGHIHPAVNLSGKGRQYLKLPCFYFGKEGALLPAFGEFTGTKTIKPSPGERVFVIANHKVMEVS